MSISDLPENILLQTLELIHGSYSSSSALLKLRTVNKTFNDWILYILFLQGSLKTKQSRPLVVLNCARQDCDKARIADLEPWPTCLARYELQGALIRSERIPPESRQFRQYLSRIRSAIKILDIELSKPESKTLCDVLLSNTRYSAITECQPFKNLASTVICQALTSFLGSAWYVNSLREGPRNRYWHDIERYTYIQSGTGLYWRPEDSVCQEQFSPRLWILLTACYIGEVSLFVRFSSDKNSRRRRSSRRVVSHFFSTLLAVAAKNGHADLVDYLVNIQDRDSPNAKRFYYAVLRAALHSGRLEIVKSVLKLSGRDSYILKAFETGNIACMLAYDRSERHKIMDLIDEHCSDLPHYMQQKFIEGAYSLGDPYLLWRYMNKDGDKMIGFTPPHIHGIPHQGHLDCVKVTSIDPDDDCKYPMAIHLTLAKQFLIKNRFDLFLKLRDVYGDQLEMAVFPQLVYADGAEPIIRDLLEIGKKNSDSSAEAGTMSALGQIAVELAAGALRHDALALLLEAGCRPYYTVQRLVVQHAVYEERKEAFYKTKALLEQYECFPLIVEE